jgi:hypothetical protein
MFPHHDEVPLYFVTHIYAKFMLHMHHDYTNTPSHFYGSGRGHSYDILGLIKTLTAISPPTRLVPLLTRVSFSPRSYSTYHISNLREGCYDRHHGHFIG